MTPFVPQPIPKTPAEGLCGFIFPMSQRQVPFGLIIFHVDPGARTQAHAHPVHEYWIVIEGSGLLVYDGNDYDISAGDLLYFEPQKSHQVINHSTQLLKIISIDWHEKL